MVYKEREKKKEKSGRLEDEKDHLPFEYLINKLYLLPQHKQMLALVDHFPDYSCN